MSSPEGDMPIETLDLPAPLTAIDSDLTDFKFMPVEVARLQKSKAWRIIARRDPALGFYMMNLWLASWHERPAASLEDDDEVLCDAAMCDPSTWKNVREHALRGWVKCSDGRLYHPVVAEKANESWAAKQSQRQRTAAATEARKSLKSPSKPRRKPPRQRDDGRGGQRDDDRNDYVTSTKGQGQGERQGKGEGEAAAARAGARQPLPLPPPIARLAGILRLAENRLHAFRDFPDLLSDWISRGVDPDADVWPIVERIAARGRQIDSPRYLVDAVFEARDGRLRDAQRGTTAPSATQPDRLTVLLRKMEAEGRLHSPPPD